MICNSGFELVSEALHLGRHVLARPLHGQMEQHSNALALEQLGLGRVAHRLDHATLTAFLATDGPAPRRHWPDVAAAIAAWVVDRDESLAELATRLWLACDPRLACPAAGCGPHKKRPAIVSPAFLLTGRSERIRTFDPCLPKAVLYQAELHSDASFHAACLYARAAL